MLLLALHLFSLPFNRLDTKPIVTYLDLVAPIHRTIDPTHQLFDQLLQKYVSESGMVNYAGFIKDTANLALYINTLVQRPVNAKSDRNEALAYWINLYNALTIKLICEHYPVASIKDLDAGKPWDVKRVTIGGRSYSLNEIENNILRPMGEPLIHFAINCAAQSCPPLWNHAWTAENLKSRLETQAKKFINNASFNKIGSENLQLSEIFNWYGKDFGDLPTFLNKYGAVKINANPKIQYINYDWKLNKAAPGRP